MTGELKASEIREILCAIRDVEATLEDRARRIHSVNMMITGLAVASIFTFYQLVTWNPRPYADALGPLLMWVWLFPIALAFVASAIAGTRLGRVQREQGDEVDRRWLWVPAAVATTLGILLTLLGEWSRIPGVVVVVCGSALAISRHRYGPANRGIPVLMGAAGIAGGVALAAFAPDWAPLAAATYYLAGLAGIGAVKYASGP